MTTVYGTPLILQVRYHRLWCIMPSPWEHNPWCSVLISLSGCLFKLTVITLCGNATALLHPVLDYSTWVAFLMQWILLEAVYTYRHSPLPNISTPIYLFVCLFWPLDFCQCGRYYWRVQRDILSTAKNYSGRFIVCWFPILLQYLAIIPLVTVSHKKQCNVIVIFFPFNKPLFVLALVMQSVRVLPVTMWVFCTESLL